MLKINLNARFYQLIMQSMRRERTFQQGDERNYRKCIQKIKKANNITVLNKAT